MMAPHRDCDTIRPLLFAMTEGQLSRTERVQVSAHLAICASCRSTERAERALTAAMTTAQIPDAPSGARQRKESPRRSRTLVFAGGLLAVVGLLLVLPAATPRGSLTDRRLSGSLEWEITSQHAVQESNHISVPAAARITVDLASGLQLAATGPARFELDQTHAGWKIVVLRGAVHAETERAQLLTAAHRDGITVLEAGRWVLSADGARPDRLGATDSASEPIQDPDLDVAQLLAKGNEIFAGCKPGTADERRSLARAAGHFRRAWQAPEASPRQRETALFFLAACHSRRDEHAKAIELQKRWISLYPTNEQRTYVLYFLAHHLCAVGEAAQARTHYEQIIQEEPSSTLAELSRTHLSTLGVVATKPAPTPAAAVAKWRTATAPETAAPLRSTPYLVVRVDLDASKEADRAFLATAQRATTFHSATAADWDGRDFDALRTLCQERRPENVLFVLRPDTLDVQLHRRILLALVAVDADPFVDAAFGYLTGRDGAAAQALWERNEQLHKRGLANAEWRKFSVTSGPRSLRYPDSLAPVVAAAGFRGGHDYVSIDDPEKFDFVRTALAAMRDASVVQFTGNGDPQGIWLFPGERNLDRSKHWPFDPARVGRDPEGVLHRLDAAMVRAHPLSSPIVWSGTCHCAATDRVYVEGDIVSTFGRTEATTVYRLQADEALSLAWLDAGAAALLAPIGPNHGMSVSMETQFALRHGASLGETVKSTYDDVCLAADGKLQFDLPREGQPHRSREPIMQGGGANRILIGDPALRPFEATADPMESVEVRRRDKALIVEVRRAAGFVPRAWDMFGLDRERDWRVLQRVDLDAAGFGAGAERLRASVEVHADDASSPDRKLPFVMQRCTIEVAHGRRYLHLQANGERALAERKALRATFRIEVDS